MLKTKFSFLYLRFFCVVCKIDFECCKSSKTMPLGLCASSKKNYRLFGEKNAHEEVLPKDVNLINKFTVT